MADNKVKFWPIRGTEAQVKQHPPGDGKIYFTTDTNKIYLDVDGSHRLMGNGNSGIIYANGSDSTIVEIEENTNIFTISFSALDNDGEAPQINSLILNSDGRFFRVTAVDENARTFTALLLAVSGSGGGSGGGGSYSFVFINDIDDDVTKYFILNDPNATIKFICTSNIELNNKIESITYDFGNGVIINDNTSHALNEPISFNISPYFNAMSLNRTNSLKITVTDAYQSQKAITYLINVVELTLSSTFNTIYKVNKGEDFTYFCTPRGGSGLANRELRINLYTEDNPQTPIKSITQIIQSSGIEQTKTISTDDLSHGKYILTAQLVGSLSNGTPLTSNLLSYNLIIFDENNNTPILTAIAPAQTIEQYSTITIPYMLVYNSINDESEIIRKIGLNETTLSIPNNVVNNWTISFDSVGTYELELRYSDSVFIKFPMITVTQYAGDAPVIDESLDSLKLNLKVENRSNDEVNRAEWNYGEITGELSNFKWGQVNGWIRDEDNVECLKLTNGAKVVINYEPFAKDAGEKGKTIELDFKVSGVTDYSKPLISCLSYDLNNEIFNGIRVTGQESTLNSNSIHTANATIVEVDDDDQAEILYNTRIQALTSRFTEDERMHISYVIEKKTDDPSIKPLVSTYLNGVISGITEYENNDYFQDAISSPAKIIIDSTYADVYLYNIRVYDAALDGRIILNNYLATLSTLNDKISQFEWNNIVDDNGNISLDLIQREGYNLQIPYILLTGGHEGTKKAGYKDSDDGYHLPYAKKDYRLMSMEYHDPRDSSKDFEEKLHFADSVGNETDDINAIDTSYSATSGVLVYGQGTSSMEYPVKNLRIKLLNSTFQVYENGYPVNLLCFKADYMESSGSHNTGTGNLVYNLYNNLRLKTPAQEFFENISDPEYNYKYVTAIKGFPTIIFFRENENSEYTYVGKYNLNLDKATQEPFGFFHYNKDGHKFGLDESGKETIHCVEWLNNASALCNFLGNPSTIDEVFDAEWANSFESRYPEDDDLSKVPAFKNFVKWVNSTNPATATNEEIEPITYDNINYTTDSAEYRLAKFKNEVWEHMDKDFTLFYYVLTHILLMIDSRAKNMMMATWDDQHWYPIFYDMDTMLGLNNYGYNKYNYDVEDTTGGIYNGQNSVLWNNLRTAFPHEIAAMYQAMRQDGGLTYNNLISIYNKTEADAWNEVLCNADAKYKYVRPYVNGYYNGLSGEAVWVKPYNKSYLYAAQGRRSFHRQWWLSNRLNYFDGKYATDSFIGDRIALRIYNLSNATESKDIESAAAVPPNADFALTPFKNGYLSVAYGGTNGYITAPHYTTANTTYIVQPDSGTSPNDTETYICGASQLKDIGDLSAKYMGNFDLSGVSSCKLTRLILGNHNPKYYNKNLTIASIGTATPYLEEIDITNTELTSLDLTNCLRIKNILAAGSKLTEISLPGYGLIEELRLPKTIGTLVLDNQTYLTDFSIGDLEIINDEEVYTEASSYNLISLTVKNTLVDSYNLVMKSPSLQRYQLTDVNWYITEDALLAQKKLSVLEKLRTLSTVDNTARNLALTGTITIGVDNNETPIDAFAIYNEYHLLYPNLTIKYDIENHPTMNLSSVINISFLNHSGAIQTFAVLPQDPEDNRRTPELYESIINEVETPSVPSTVSTTYIFDGVWSLNNVNYTKEEIRTLLNSVNYDCEFIPQFTETIRKYNVIFYTDENGSEVLETKQIEYNNNIIKPAEIPYKDDSALSLTQTYKFKGFTSVKGSSQITDVTQITVQRDWEFYPVFKQQSVYEETTDLSCFTFIDGVKYIDADNVPSSVANSSYNWNDSSGGYAISIKPGVILKGKVTLPSYYNGKPIIEIASGSFGTTNNIGYYRDSNTRNITHIFWKESQNEPCRLRKISSYAFAGLVDDGGDTSLQYIELPNSLRYIGSSAFFCCGNLKTITPIMHNENEIQENAIILPNNLAVIHNAAFNGVFKNLKSFVVNKIQIPPSVACIGLLSFGNINASVNEVIMGTKNESSGYLYYIDNQRYESILTSLPNYSWYSHNSNFKTTSFIFYHELEENRSRLEEMYQGGMISGVTNFSCVDWTKITDNE